MKFTVEDHVPIPRGRRGPWVAFRDAFNSLVDGQSILVEIPEGKNAKNVAGNIRSILVRDGYRKAYTLRMVEQGIRVWKVKKNQQEEP